MLGRPVLPAPSHCSSIHLSFDRINRMLRMEEAYRGRNLPPLPSPVFILNILYILSKLSSVLIPILPSSLRIF